MSIVLSPPELDFKRPFDREVIQVLHLNNQNEESVVFKVKTTAPKHYCVRPNSGRIESGKHVEVQVLLQAMKDEPAIDAKCKDKFLVQTVLVSPDLEHANIQSIFEKATKANIQERKIRVNWLAPDSDPSSEQGAETNGADADDEPPSYNSPSANFETPAVGLSKKSEDTSPIPPPDFSERQRRDTVTPQSKEPSSVAGIIPTSTDDLKTQLSEANSQIQKLKDRLSEQGLRQRKIGGESAPSSAPMAQQQQSQSSVSGVPVQIVAGLCLISFLLAYFFF